MTNRQIHWQKLSGSPFFYGAGSVVVHAVFFAAILAIAMRDTLPKVKQEPVKLTVIEKKPEAIPPKPPPEKPKPKPPPVPPSLKKLPEPTQNVKPVQGVTAESLQPDGKGIAVPVGNTLMKEDTGERPKDVQPYSQDMTADAQLITGSFSIPEYTESALDANLEGVFTVDVFLDEQGNVQDVELRKPIGYGMDDLILGAARLAKFSPRKNRMGAGIAGWAELRFRMQIP